MNDSNPEHIDWCADPEGAEGFVKAQTTWLAERHARSHDRIMSPENTLRFRHGGAFLNPARGEGRANQMEEHSVVSQVRFEDLLHHNLDAWAGGLIELSDAMQKSFMGMFIRTMDQVTERTGNAVNVIEAGSFPQAFLDVLRKIEFGVDRNGKVTLPTMMVHPDVADKQIAALEAQSQEFEEEVERIITEKSELALRSEAERRARFKVG